MSFLEGEERWPWSLLFLDVICWPNSTSCLMVATRLFILRLREGITAWAVARGIGLARSEPVLKSLSVGSGHGVEGRSGL